MSIQSILASAFNTLATRGSIRTSGYAVPTSACTSLDRLSSGDRMLAALWVANTIDKTLDAVGRAYVTYSYEGGTDADQDAAIDALTDHLMVPKGNRELLRACVARERIIGESYCPSFATLAKQTGSSKSVAGRVGERVRLAMIQIADGAHDALRPAFEQKGYA